MNSFFKQAVIGAVLAFGLIPTLLIMKLAVLQRTPHAPLSQNLVSIYALYGSVSLAVFIVVGLPLLAIFRWRGWHSLLSFSLGGTAVALVGVALLVGVQLVDFRETWTSSSLMEDTITLAVCGFVSGAVFWRLARRQISRGT